MSGEQARLWAKNSTKNLEAWEKWLQGDEYFFRFTKEDNATARRLFEEAIALDPEYAFAYVMLGWTYFIDARFGWVDSRGESIRMAGKYAQKGMELNDALDNSYYLMGSVYFLQGQHEKAIAEVERAIALNPNGANNYNGLAAMVGLSGRWDESIQLVKKAIRLRPDASVTYYHTLGRAYFMTGQYDEATATLKKILHKNPNYLPAHAFLAACYSSLDRQPEAAAAVDEVRRINPKFNLESYAKTLPYKNKADIERYIAALSKAGLPEKSTLPLPDKPSIAVLAFDNLSGDPDQEYFSDGMTDELISDLAKIENILVISRNSAFSFKARKMKIAQIAKELNVRYVLEGSVQKSGNKVRIRAQLIDGKSDHHIWSESYDGGMNDIFELQDKITEKIVSALAVKLSSGEENRRTQKQTSNYSAYIAYLKGMAHLRLYTPDAVVKAIEFFKEAVTLDSNYGDAYTALAEAYRQIGLGSRELRRKLGVRYEDCSIIERHYLNQAMNNPVPKTFAALARLETTLRDWDMEGIERAGRDGGTKIYITIDQNYKLTDKKIRKLMFRKTEIVSGYFGDEFFYRKEGGDVIFQLGDSVKKGLSWIGGRPILPVL